MGLLHHLGVDGGRHDMQKLDAAGDLVDDVLLAVQRPGDDVVTVDATSAALEGGAEDIAFLDYRKVLAGLEGARQQLGHVLARTGNTLDLSGG